MENIVELTPEQEALLDRITSEYEQISLGGDDSYDADIITEGINFIYKMTDLKPPEIVICNSPGSMVVTAALPPDETYDYIGQGYDVGWTAWADAMQQLGVEYDPAWGFDTWKRLIKESGMWAMLLYENTAYVCIRPCLVERDTEGNLHSETGPAIAWRDGYCQYYLHGVAVPAILVETPARDLDPTMLLKERNAEVRREIVRKIGMDRIIAELDAETLDTDGDIYELLLLNLGDGRNRPYLKMRNPSIGMWHVEGVPPGITTVAAALAWRNESDERPEVLT